MRTAVFLHIPKTAGTTVSSVLSLQYAGRPSHWIPPMDLHGSTLERMEPEERSRLALLRGHMYFGLHRFLGAEATYFTFVREPEKRILSYLSYARREAGPVPRAGEGWWTAYVREASDEAILSDGKDVEVENGQVRRISGKGFEKTPCTRQDLERALRNLEERFCFTGTTTNIEAGLFVLGRILGWSRPIVVASAKVSREARPAPSPGVMELIRERNAWDAALYVAVEERCLRLFEDPEVKAGAEAVRRRSRILGPIVDAGRRLRRLGRQ